MIMQREFKISNDPIWLIYVIWMYWFKYPITRWGVYLAGVTEYSDTSGYFEIWYQILVFYYLEIICNDIY